MSLLLKRTQSQFIGARRFPSVSLLLGLTCLIIMAFPPLAEILQFNRAGLGGVSWVTWITCHLTHWSWDHFLWDVLVFIFLGGFLERKFRNEFCWCLILSAFLISLTVWVFLPSLQFYRGLSGIGSALFGLFISLMIQEAYSKSDRVELGFYILFGLGFLCKTIFEIYTGQALFVESAQQMVPVPLAHIVGFLTGALCAKIKAFNAH